MKRGAKALGLAVCSSEKGPGSRADDGEKSQMKLKGWDTGTGKSEVSQISDTPKALLKGSEKS